MKKSKKLFAVAYNDELIIQSIIQGEEGSTIYTCEENNIAEFDTQKELNEFIEARELREKNELKQNEDYEND